MKKSIVVLSVCCIILFIFSVSGRNIHRTASTTAPQSSAQTTGNPIYEIRVNDGCLAVYPYGSDDVLEETEIRVSSLPDYDQQLLAYGYPIYTETQLMQFLEDYGS